MTNAIKIKLSSAQKEILKKIIKSRVARSDHRQRAKLILLFDKGLPNRQAGPIAKINEKQAGMWRKRWLENRSILETMESSREDNNSKFSLLKKRIEQILSDKPRSGKKPKFTAEQVAKILAVACEKPEESDLPFSRWTLPLLQAEVIKRGIVDTISTSRLQVFLK